MALESCYEGIQLRFDFDELLRAALPPLLQNRHDLRHRTVVCRHWLKGLCQKGDYCEVCPFILSACFTSFFRDM
jgi:hypothetical protein